MCDPCDYIETEIEYYETEIEYCQTYLAMFQAEYASCCESGSAPQASKIAAPTVPKDAWLRRAAQTRRLIDENKALKAQLAELVKSGAVVQ
jgi:hypothetical protein